MSGTSATPGPDRPTKPARADKAQRGKPSGGAGGAPAERGGPPRSTARGDGRQAFARQFSDSMARGSWTARALARQLAAAGTPVSAATLGAWRCGLSAPDHPAGSAVLAMAEILLDIPAGDLALRLAPRTRQLRPIQPLVLYTGRADAAASAAGLAGSTVPATAADRVGQQPLALAGVAWHHHVGADGRLAYSRAMVATRALDELVGGYWLLHHDTGGGPPPAWEAGRGSWILAVQSDRPGLVAAEIGFPRWLSPGDYHVFTVALRHTHPPASHTGADGGPSRYVACALPVPVARVSLRLTFHTPPRRLQQAQWDLHPEPDLAHPTPVQEVDPNNTGGAFFRLDGSAAAAYGWRWD